MGFKTLALLFASSLVAASAQSVDADEALVTPLFKLGSPTFFGSGCPEDTVTIVPSTDGQLFSARFATYNASTSADTKQDRTSCNLAVPLDVAPGFSLGVFRVDYRGSVSVPNVNGAYAQFDAEYFFAGQRGTVVTKTFTPGTSSSLFLTNDVPGQAITWSACGASTIFRVNSAIEAYTPSLNASDDVQIAIQSADTGFRYFFTWRRCN